MSTQPVLISSHQPPSSTCADCSSLLEGLYKAYVDCNAWCAEKCPKGENLDPLQLRQMLEACQKECRAWQLRSPSHTS